METFRKNRILHTMRKPDNEGHAQSINNIHGMYLIEFIQVCNTLRIYIFLNSS